jgi:hypothetical protein
VNEVSERKQRPVFGGPMSKDFCKQCGRVVDGGSHNWTRHQPKQFQSVLCELGFNSALTTQQHAVVVATK